MGKCTKTQLNITNERQEVSHFPKVLNCQQQKLYKLYMCSNTSNMNVSGFCFKIKYNLNRNLLSIEISLNPVLLDKCARLKFKMQKKSNITKKKRIPVFLRNIGLELAIETPSPRGNFVHYDFLKLHYIRHKIKDVSPLRVAALTCNITLYTLTPPNSINRT